MTQAVVTPRAALANVSVRSAALLLFVSLVGIYHLNGTIIEEGDAIANMALPISLLEHDRLSFTPNTNPEIFNWKSAPPLDPQDRFYVRTWRSVIDGQLSSSWRADGHLRFNGPRYFAVRAPRREAYVNTFGPAPGLSLVPLFAVMKALDSLFPYKWELRLSIGKLHAASLTAASAVFVYLAALGFTTRGLALLLAAAYGLGSCAFSIASQALWQQTLSMFLLSLGAWLTLTLDARRMGALLAGLAFGAALGTRHTALLVIVPIGVQLLRTDRRAALQFALGLCPVPLAIAIYNQHYFGSPLSFAQEVVGHVIATQKTGQPGLWQTPLWLGVSGLLFSPSRGLLVFSPFLFSGFWGATRIWQDDRYARLRPLSIGVFAVMLLQAKWFDWWGGWAYGYRPWLDMMPLFSLFMAPALDAMRGSVLRWVWVLALAWSVFVQGVGAFSYDKSWNARLLFLVEHPGGRREIVYDDGGAAEARALSVGGRVLTAYRCNVDERHCRYRLWSIEDNVVGYYLENFSQTRRELLLSGWHQFEIR